MICSKLIPPSLSTLMSFVLTFAGLSRCSTTWGLTPNLAAMVSLPCPSSASFFTCALRVTDKHIPRNNDIAAFVEGGGL